jgi:hypothetical protein
MANLYILGLGDGNLTQYLLSAYDSLLLCQKIRDILINDTGCDFYIECVENIKQKEIDLAFQNANPNELNIITFENKTGNYVFMFKNPFYINLPYEQTRQLIMELKSNGSL